MQKTTLSIKLRIGLFAGLLLCMILGINLFNWNILRSINSETESGLQQLTLLSQSADAADAARAA